MPGTPNNVSWTPAEAGASGAGYTAARRQGYRTRDDTTTAPLRASTYEPDGVNAQRSVLSGSADDAAGGTGARKVIITYFDQDLVGPKTEEVILNGTTPVDLFATDVAYVESIEVSEVGGGGANAATITLAKSTGGGGGVLGQVNAGDNRTFWAHHYVPDGETHFLTELMAGAVGDDGVLGSSAPSARLDLAYNNPTNTLMPQHTIEAFLVHGPTLPLRFGVPIQVEGPALVFVNATAHDATGANPVDVVGTFAYYGTGPQEEFVSVYPVNPPTPANGNLTRSLFVWLTNNGNINDVPSTDQAMQAFLNHCAAQGINTVYLGIYSYLGAANWNATRLARIQLLVEKCHASGIKVYALSGDVGWGTAHSWVLTNVLMPLQRYQALSSAEQQFDGTILDVEYWTDEGTYPPATNLPGLLDLVRKFRDTLNKPCGLFSAFGMMGGEGGVGTRTSISYRGKSAQDGEHMMDHADFVVIGCYWHGSAGMSDRYISWYNYAKAATASGRNVGLLCGVETLDSVGDTLSWWQEGIAAMESAMATFSGTYYVAGDSVFVGFAVHDWEHHSTMPA